MRIKYAGSLPTEYHSESLEEYIWHLISLTVSIMTKPAMSYRALRWPGIQRNLSAIWATDPARPHPMHDCRETVTSSHHIHIIYIYIECQTSIFPPSPARIWYDQAWSLAKCRRSATVPRPQREPHCR